MFTPEHHDLKFLEIPEFVYWAMTHHSGLPNRILIDQYRQCAYRLSGDCQFLITHLAYAGPVEPHVHFEKIPQNLFEAAFAGLKKHKKDLASPFQKTHDSDLIVSGFFLILKKQTV
jgi:hypothetical protein